MAPTAIINGIGRLELIYSRGGYPPFRSNIFVDAVDVGGVYKIENGASSSQLTLDEFWDAAFKTKWLELFPTSMGMSQLKLWTYQDGAWTLRETATETEAGTGELSPAVCTVMTLTFRDTAGKYARMELIEPDILAPASLKHGENWGDLDSFLTDCITHTTTGTNMGSYILSRGGHSLQSVVNWSVKISDRMRRERGYI